MTGKFKDENFKVVIPGTKFTLEANKTYRIIGNVDPSSPVEFQERGITKLEHPLNGENGIMRFSRDRNLWDTGLYLGSPRYSDHDVKSEDANTAVEVLNKVLVPYLKEIFPEGVLENNRADNNYWDSYSFPLNQNFTISTSTPEKFFGLWISVLHGAIAPDGEQKKPRYRQLSTPYVIVNTAEKTSNKQKIEFNRSKAISNFILALEEDKKFLIEVLNYSGFRASSGTSDNILNSMFSTWVGKKEGSKNAKYFNKNFKTFKTEEGREELEIYKILDKGVKNNIITFSRSEYFLGETSIGNNIKEAAKKINTNDELKGTLLELTK